MDDTTTRKLKHTPRSDQSVSPGSYHPHVDGENVLSTKRLHEVDEQTPNKAPFSMFSRLFGARRQSVTREDFDKTWGRLEERKEYYKGRAERLVSEVTVKDKRIKDLEREVQDLRSTLGEKQSSIRSILGNLDGFFEEFKVRFADEYDEDDDEGSDEAGEEREGDGGGDAGVSGNKGGFGGCKA